jgi:RND family efflux transporter MFP subunit
VHAAVRSEATRELRLSGTLAADRSSVVSFSTMGTIQQVLVEEGAQVKRGQVLARLFPRSFEDALGIAKAKADQAEDAYRRMEPMSKNKTLPEVKMVEIETGRQQARLSLSMAQKSLQDTVLQAPEAGVVSRRHVEPGANVIPGMPVVTLVQIRTLQATAPVPEKQISKVKKGDVAKVMVSALGKTLDGVVHEIAVIADPLTRTYEIKVAVPNSSQELRVGMVVEVRLRIPGEAAGVVVPPEAVRVNEAGAPCVFVVDKDTRLQRRNIEVTGFIGEGTAIASGVAEGEMVVTSGTPMLAHGMAVNLAGGLKVGAARP